jgi:o-succinylbenzoate synthase
MLKLKIKKHNLQFKIPAGTSRGTLYNKPSWFIILKDTENDEKVGYGECSIIPKLSIDNALQIEDKLSELSQSLKNWSELNTVMDNLNAWPAIKFALETACLDLKNGASRTIYHSPFTEGFDSIPINGLIWMGNQQSMFDQIKEKLDTGWNCIKMKIGAIDFEAEIELLKFIRSQFSADEITIRVDANGAFRPADAQTKLKRLSAFDIHSIEQPIAAGQWDKMALLCDTSPIPIALDEELIGINDTATRKKMIQSVQPQYIILKPALLGGFESADNWISIAKENNIQFWSTSALESNIGLNAIAQWAATIGVNIPQGLGTGKLYHNNIDCPLETDAGHLWNKKDKTWDLNFFDE